MSSGFTDWLREYGLWSLLIGTFLEGEGSLLTAGGLVYEGILPLGGAWLIGALGAYLGHLIYYSLGRFSMEKHLLSRFPKWRPGIERALPLIRKHPWRSVFILQYLYGMRVVGAIAIGLSGMSWRVFIGIEALNCLIWSAIVLAVGYGATFEATAWLHAANRPLRRPILILISVGICYFIFRRRTRSRRKRGKSNR